MDSAHKYRFDILLSLVTLDKVDASIILLSFNRQFVISSDKVFDV